MGFPGLAFAPKYPLPPQEGLDATGAPDYIQEDFHADAKGLSKRIAVGEGVRVEGALISSIVTHRR